MIAVSPTTTAGTYVYCIAWGAPFEDGYPPLRARAIGGRGDPVRSVTFMDLAAIVIGSPARRFDIARENTMTHQLVAYAGLRKHSHTEQAGLGDLWPKAQE